VTNTLVLDEEQRADRFTELVQRLSHQSVVKHFDAYADVAWDDPAYAIDPRTHAGSSTTTRASARPSGIAVSHRTCARVSVARHRREYESGLAVRERAQARAPRVRVPAARPQSGVPLRLPRGHRRGAALADVPGVRQPHGALDVPGLTWDLKFGARRVIGIARRFPALFFVFVLGGEDPIDHVQRTELRSGRDLHPLLERIMRIHVTEEARHLSFARQYLLRQHADAGPSSASCHRDPGTTHPGADGVGDDATTPAVSSASIAFRRTYSPRLTVPLRHRADATRESLRKVRDLLTELGLVTPLAKRLWKALGIWDEPAGNPAIRRSQRGRTHGVGPEAGRRPLEG